MDRKYVTTALGYGLLGMLLGIYMAASKNHIQHVTHAHILLIGFVVSFIYAVIYKLWLTANTGTIGKIQFWAHQVGTAVIVIGLFLLYGGYAPESALGPVLGIASLAVLTGILLMKVMYLKAVRA